MNRTPTTARRSEAMPDWSQLPRDLLGQIARCLDNSVDLLRFRSVCNFWRGSVWARPRSLPFRFPILLPNDGISVVAGGFHVYRRTIYRLGLLHSPQNWLLKVEEHGGGGGASRSPRMHLFNPLYGPKLTRSSLAFPQTPLDLCQTRISKLGHEYVLKYVNSPPFAVNRLGDNMYMEKAVLATHSDGSYAVLTIHVSGKLAVLNSGDKNWSVIDDFPSPYDDVILFHDNFYASDCMGRTVTVDLHPDSPPSVRLVAGPVFGGDKKRLVECGRRLLLVDIYLSIGAVEEDEEDGDAGDGRELMDERVFLFKIYWLDWSRKSWFEVESLGDDILFLGDSCTFSASALDFPGCRGNCIIFTDGYLSCDSEEEDLSYGGRSINMFSLDDGTFHSLTNLGAYSKLFWPPPDWAHLMLSEANINCPEESDSDITAEDRHVECRSASI